MATLAPGRIKRSGAMVEVERWQQTLSSWLDKKAAAEEALAHAESTSGDDVLEDPSLVEKAAADMRTARDEIDLATKAAHAARAKLDAARVAVLESEARRFDDAAKTIEKRLSAHKAKTNELLAVLEAHEGRFVPQVELMRERRSSGTARDDDEWSFPRSEDIAMEAECERTRAAVVRDVAAGVDPRIRLSELENIVDSSILGRRVEELYPPCVWGPDAVIPAPLFTARVEAVRSRLAAHDAELDVDDAPEIAKRQEVIDRIDEKEVAFKKTHFNAPSTFELQARAARIKWIEDRKKWRKEAPARREVILAELEALTGSRKV